MSSRKRTVVFSPEAQDDFIDIRVYTQQEWGEAQRDRYEAALLRTIAAPADYPEASVRMPRLFPGCRPRPVERHIVYYRIMDDVIEVARILHERTDPARHIEF